jgi:hypothetical protein
MAGLTGQTGRSDRHCVSSLTDLGQRAGGHVTIDLKTELIVNSDICAHEIENRLENPFDKIFERSYT